MDHREIERGNLIERYLAGNLSDTELARFEEHFLACQSCLDELELSEAFREGLRQTALEGALVEGALTGGAPEAPVAPRLSPVASFPRVLRSPKVGLLAAAALVAMLLPSSWALYLRGQISQRDRELEATRAPQQNTLILPLSPERGASDEAPSVRLTLPSSPGWIVLSLELNRPDRASYQVRLVTAEGKTLWSGKELTPTYQDTLTVSLHSSFLAPGDYTLEVEGLDPGDNTPAGRFSFRVLPARP